MSLAPVLRKHSRGFTLIELLVVIAIIGLLSAVVLASLSTARSKGNDAAIKSDLNTFATQAALDYDGDGNVYSGAATNVLAPGAWPAARIGTGIPGSSYPITTVVANLDPVTSNAMIGASNASGSNIQWGTIMPTATTFASYVVQAQLTATSSWWCVDSSGNAKYEYAQMTASAPPPPNCP